MTDLIDGVVSVVCSTADDGKKGLIPLGRIMTSSLTKQKTITVNKIGIDSGSITQVRASAASKSISVHTHNCNNLNGVLEFACTLSNNIRTIEEEEKNAARVEQERAEKKNRGGAHPPRKKRARTIASRTRTTQNDDVCAACQGTKTEYWSDGVYGTCMSCILPGEDVEALSSSD
jgi:hypothetical protein